MGALQNWEVGGGAASEPHFRGKIKGHSRKPFKLVLRDSGTVLEPSSSTVPTISTRLWLSWFDVSKPSRTWTHTITVSGRSTPYPLSYSRHSNLNNNNNKKRQLIVPHLVIMNKNLWNSTTQHKCQRSIGHIKNNYTRLCKIPSVWTNSIICINF